MKMLLSQKNNALLLIFLTTGLKGAEIIPNKKMVPYYKDTITNPKTGLSKHFSYIPKNNCPGIQGFCFQLIFAEKLDIFNTGRSLGDALEKFYFETDTPYKKNDEKQRINTIKMMLKARDFSMIAVGYYAGNSKNNIKSLISTTIACGFGITIEAALQSKIINHCFSVDESFIQKINQHNHDLIKKQAKYKRLAQQKNSILAKNNMLLKKLIDKDTLLYNQPYSFDLKYAQERLKTMQQITQKQNNIICEDI
jgi:hypothetical protein